MSDRPMHTVPGLFDRLAALYAEGESALSERRYDDAIRIFSEGISLDDHFRQRYVTMYAQRAFAHQCAGHHEAAFEDYRRAVAMEPPINQAQYFFQGGMCLAALGRFADAVDAYDRSLAIETGQPGPYHLRGKLLTLELGRHADAIADFDRFLERWQHPEVLELRGYAKIQSKRPVEAIADLTAAEQMNPNPYTSYLLATAASLAQNDELALRAIGTTLGADPSYREYFAQGAEFERLRADARFRALVGA